MKHDYNYISTEPKHHGKLTGIANAPTGNGYVDIIVAFTSLVGFLLTIILSI